MKKINLIIEKKYFAEFKKPALKNLEGLLRKSLELKEKFLKEETISSDS